MNVWLTRAALRTRGLSAGAFRVLLAHANACRPSGRTCLAGLEELAQACELSPKHVMRLRAHLVEAGHLRKLTSAHPGQRPVYEVLPAVPIPLPAPQDDIPATSDHVATSGRTAAVDGSHGCDPPYKPQGITPLPPSERARATHRPWRGGGVVTPSPALVGQAGAATRQESPTRTRSP